MRTLTVRKVWRRLGILAAVCVIGLLLAVWQVSSQGEEGQLFLEHSTWQAPFVRVLAWGKDSLDSLCFADRLARQNTALIERNLSLQSEVARLKALERENGELREMLALKGKRREVAVAAEVLARDPQDWFAQVIIDKGHADGVEQDMVALANGSLLGRVCATQPHSAQVRLLTDERSAVPIALAASGATGILYGTEKRTCMGRYFQNNVKFALGELVQTSGLGDVYPPGLVVGRICQAAERGDTLFKEMEIQPSVNLGTLHRVLLLRKEGAPIPSPAGNTK